jgi:hypothetical protein
VKRSGLNTNDVLFSAGPRSSSDNATGLVYLQFEGDTLAFTLWTGASTNVQLKSTPVYRDPSAWYHIVAVLDTDNATSTDRWRLYVNGVRITAFNTATYPSSGATFSVNDTTFHEIGRYAWGQNLHFPGYLADVFFIDSQALDPSSFTEVSATTGQLIPKAYTGTFTGNSFWLKFADNSAATATTLGKDSSGLGNNCTPNNLTAAEYRVIDAPSLSNGAMIVRGASGGSVTVTISGTGTKNYFTSTNGIDWTWQSGAASATYTANYIAAGGAGTNSRIAVSAGVFQYAMWNTNTNFDSSSNTTADTTGLTFTTTTNNGANGDSLVDTPSSAGTDTGVGGEVTGNYCTWNPLNETTGTRTLTNGNLDASIASTGGAGGTVRFNTGKWYYEATINSTGDARAWVGWLDESFPRDRNDWSYGSKSIMYASNAARGTDNGSYGATFTAGDVIGCALDLDGGTATFYKNGVSQGTMGSSLGATNWRPVVSTGGTAWSITANFGQRQWAYAAPSGFRPLVDTLLPAPVVAKPNTVMDVKLYTGNGSTQTISGLEFSPDLVWIKARSTSAYNHFLLDTVRGVNNELNSNTTDFEYTRPAPGSLTAFNSDGFNLNTAIGVNASSTTYAAWCWDAGTTTTTNTVGSITSQVRANASAGFSIVTYTGNLSSSGTSTVGHGLGVKPAMIITKKRSGTSDWAVQHSGLPSANNLLGLNTTGATYTSSYGTIVAPTSNVFTIAWLTDMGDNGAN